MTFEDDIFLSHPLVGSVTPVRKLERVLLLPIGGLGSKIPGGIEEYVFVAPGSRLALTSFEILEFSVLAPPAI